LKYLFKRYEKMIAEEETQGTLFAKEIKNEVEEKISSFTIRPMVRQRFPCMLRMA
jgi:hypothetical protein